MDANSGDPVDMSDNIFTIDWGTAIQNEKPDKFNGSFYIVPNPADKSTTDKISFYVTSPVEITEAVLKVYDAVGNELFALIENRHFTANTQHLLGNWDLKGKNGKVVSSGNHLVVLKIVDKNGKLEMLKEMIGVKAGL